VRRDSNVRAQEAKATLNGQEVGWDAKFKEYSNSLVTLSRDLEQLKRKGSSDLTETEQKQRANLDAALKTARVAFDEFLLGVVRETSRASAERAVDVGERNLTSLRALQGTLGQLGDGVVAVHYLMGKDRLHIILTTPSVQLVRTVSIADAALNAQIQSFRSRIQTPELSPLKAANELYEVLVAPIAADLKQAQAKTLMLSLDGTLRYVPFAALYDGQRYLVESYRIAIFTEAARDKLKDVPKAKWQVAGLGLTTKVGEFSALPSVKEELESIVNVSGKGLMPGTVKLDAAFSRDSLLDALDRGVPVLHIASHFAFRPGTEADSFLVLGNGTRLSLKEIREGDFDFRNVELLTLSACETAVGGGADANGREVEGLASLAQKQGAKGVLATLWPVADESTSILMRQVYRLREEKAGVSKAEALRNAQIMLLRGNMEGVAHSAEFRHPFYWAPFVLMGNWL
jgi:CHAT domain-containing protein